MGRTTLIAVLGAAVVGSVGGGLAALHVTSPAPRAARAAPAIPTAAPVPPADAGVAEPAIAAPTGADAGAPATASPLAPQHTVLATQMSAVLTRFAAWSRDHADAPCPDLASLGLAARDPWGHDLVLTCTDQPADQRSGVRSAGPDAVFGTEDDVASWSLGPAVTNLVRGPRWKAAGAPPTRAPARRRNDPPVTGERPPAASPAAPSVRDPAPMPAGSAASSPTNAVGSAAPAPTLPPPPEPTGDDIPARRSSR